MIDGTRRRSHPRRSQVLVLVGQRHGAHLLQLLLVLRELVGVDRDLWRFERGRLDEGQVGVADELACEPQEGLLEVVVGFGRDVVVLEVLLAVERDLLGLHLALLHIHLVPHEHDRDRLAHAHEVAVPVGHVFVRDARRHVEHDDSALALDVVAVTQPAKLLLAGRVPHVEHDLSTVRVERERVYLHAERRDIALLELAGQMALHECGFAHATVADKH
mmetsp:Transcript_7456/g.19060  ORF Transcript_7456/g.19060 Transcript_7456/m.19060 type:complete len:218 (-) Transcript_7456:51-704(-)